MALTLLIRHREHINLDDGAFWWLYRVAVRRAWRLIDHDRREQAADAPADFLTGPCWDNDPATIAEHREALRDVARLAPRQRRLLLTRSAGFTSAEIARCTGDSLATVSRQIRQARIRLRDTAGASSDSGLC